MPAAGQTRSISGMTPLLQTKTKPKAVSSLSIPGNASRHLEHFAALRAHPACSSLTHSAKVSRNRSSLRILVGTSGVSATINLKF